MKTFKELIVWQKAVEFCTATYKVTENFPKSEIYGLTGQIRRSAVSVPSNIAEGQRRGHKSEFVQFLRISYGSAAELETQLLIAFNIGYLSERDFNSLNNSLEEILRMLNKLISSIKS